MIGISKELLEETYKELLVDYGAHPNDPAIKTCLEGLLSRCEELDPWLPIEDAPKDRYVRVFAPAYQDLPPLQQVCKWHESAGFCIDELRTPTHYKELDDEPNPN